MSNNLSLHPQIPNRNVSAEPQVPPKVPNHSVGQLNPISISWTFVNTVDLPDEFLVRLVWVDDCHWVIRCLTIPLPPYLKGSILPKAEGMCDVAGDVLLAEHVVWALQRR